MSRKRDRENLDRIEAVYSALYNEIGEVSIDEVRRSLAEAGIDRGELRERLNERAKDLARAKRRESYGASPALMRLIEQTSDATTLPADPKRALEKAKRYLTDVFTPSGAGQQPQVVGAFRGGGELSERDKEIIDEIDADLRARAEAAGGDDPKKT